EYYKVKEFISDLQGTEEQAQQKVASLQEEGKTMLTEYEELVAQAQSEILTEEARQEAGVEANAMGETIRAKELEIRQFVQNTQRSIQARRSTQMRLFFKEIDEAIKEVAAEVGATLVLDTSGAKSNGLSAVIYSDGTEDITDEVVKRINATEGQEEAAAE
ncbi:MAG: OmpH family outer membrane protein, partial [Verrucomicrobiota bacterium]